MARRGTGSSKAATSATADEWAALTVRERVIRASHEGNPINEAITKAVRGARRRSIRKATATTIKTGKSKCKRARQRLSRDYGVVAMERIERLSAKSATILKLIAEGHSYAQIVDGHPTISYLDIFAAAEDALRRCESFSDHQQRLADIRERYPRAYEPWTREDDSSLAVQFGKCLTIQQLAAEFQRQPSAIRSRLAKLGLTPESDGSTSRMLKQPPPQADSCS